MIRSIGAPSEAHLEDTFVPLRNVALEKIAAGLENGDTYWLDVVDADEKDITWLEETLKLHPAVVADLKREDRRPTLMLYPGYLFLSLVQPSIHRKRVHSHEVHCLLMDNCFVTVRNAKSTCIDEAYNRVAMNKDNFQRGVVYFLYLVTQYVIDTYYPLLDNVSMRLNKFEEAILAGESETTSRQEVYRIKQQLINLRQMIAPQREVLANVIGEERVSRKSEHRDLFRHLYERMLRVYDVIDAQRDLSSNVLDLIQSQESQRLVQAVNRLTILSMIFLPLTFFTGLFELNFATIDEPFTLPIPGVVMFFSVIALMIVSASAMVAVFRYKRWI